MDLKDMERRINRLSISKKRADELMEQRRKTKNINAIVSLNGGDLSNMRIPDLNKYLRFSGCSKAQCDAIKKKRRKYLNRGYSIKRMR